MNASKVGCSRSTEKRGDDSRQVALRAGNHDWRLPSVKAGVVHCSIRSFTQDLKKQKPKTKGTKTDRIETTGHRQRVLSEAFGRSARHSRVRQASRANTDGAYFTFDCVFRLFHKNLERILSPTAVVRGQEMGASMDEASSLASHICKTKQHVKACKYGYGNERARRGDFRLAVCLSDGKTTPTLLPLMHRPPDP